MTSIVAWRALKMQEYRYQLLVSLARLGRFGVRRPAPPVPVPAADCDPALHVYDPAAPSLLAPCPPSLIVPEPAARR